MKIKIAVIGANYQFLSFYRQAKALGYEIYSFARAIDDNPCWEIADHHYDCAFSTDKEKILDICKTEGVQGVPFGVAAAMCVLCSGGFRISVQLQGVPSHHCKQIYHA